MLSFIQSKLLRHNKTNAEINIIRWFLLFIILFCFLGNIGCAQKYKYLWKIKDRTWKGGNIPLWYNPKGQVFTEEEALRALRASVASWESACGVSFLYMGTTEQELLNRPDDKFVIGWIDGNTYRDRFGTSSLAHTRIWWNFSFIFDGEISINREEWRNRIQNNRTDVLQGIMTHELGHAIGLDHSSIVDSIMYFPYHSAIYQKTLREYDINAARELYPIVTK